MIQDFYDENGKNGKIKVGHRVGHRVGHGPGFVVTHENGPKYGNPTSNLPCYFHTMEPAERTAFSSDRNALKSF
jgi:hypothetical protein